MKKKKITDLKKKKKKIQQTNVLLSAPGTICFCTCYASLPKHQPLLWRYGNEQSSHFYIDVCLIRVHFYFFYE